MNIQGQAAIVTGGASGLGEATARELARLGAKVTVLDINAALAEKVAAEIGGVACVCDILQTDSVSAALDKAEAAHGPARILMNVAGIGSAKRIVGKDGNPAPLEDFVRKFSYMRFEPEGITGNTEIPFAKSLPDYIMRWVASRFIEDTETLEELGIMTKEVRAKQEEETSQLGLGITTDTAGPANGGNGHSQPGNGNGVEKAKATGGEAVPAAKALTETPPVRPAKMQGHDLGPACEQCGGMMQRTGSCYTCSSCGNNTGCG